MTIANSEALAKHLADLLVQKHVIAAAPQPAAYDLIVEALEDEEDAGTIRIDEPPNFAKQ